MQRAEDCPGLEGRWDFNARSRGDTQWFALEVKGLVIPQSLRQFGSWTKLCRAVTEELQERGDFRGTFTIIANVPWTFSQKQGKVLANAFVQALIEGAADVNVGDQINIGPAIASRFWDWPKDSPRTDRSTSKIIHPPQDLLVYKLDASGCSVEGGISMSEAFVVDSALYQAVSDIFASRPGECAKPNVQLREARERGASRTVLLLDSHIQWKPNTVADVLKCLDQGLLSSIDSVYLVSVHNNRVREVWP
jgi:hypothetical protein